MANQELVDFIKKQHDRGVTPTDIEKALLDVGWQDQDVQDALAAAGIGMSPKPSNPIAPLSPLSSPATGQTQLNSAKTLSTMPASSQPSTTQKTDITPPLLQAEKGPVDVFAEVDTTTGGDTKSSPSAALPISAAATAPLTPAQHAVAPAVEYKEGMSLKKKMAVFTAIILAVAVIVAAAVFAYFRFYQSPSRIGTLLVGNVAGLTSANMELTIEQTLKSGNTIMEQSTVTMSGSTTLFTSEQAASSIAVQWKNIVDRESSGASANFKSSGGKSYVQATAMEGSDEQVTELFQTFLANKWLVLDDTTRDFTAIVPLQLTNILPAAGTLTAEEQGIIRDAFRKTSVMKLTEKIDTAVIGSIKTYHYNFEVNKEELKKFIGEIAPVLKAHGRTDASISLLIKGIDAWNGINGELWVGARDYQLYRVDVTATGTRSANRTEMWKVTVKLSNHNQPVQVEVPTDAITVEDLVKAMAEAIEPTTETTGEGGIDTEVDGGTSTPSPTPSDSTTNKKKDTDGDGLTDAKESDYGTNATDPDTDDDSYLDGEEVENGYNPLGAGKLETTE